MDRHKVGGNINNTCDRALATQWFIGGGIWAALERLKVSRQGTQNNGYYLGMDANCLFGNPGGRAETRAMRQTLGPEAGKEVDNRGRRIMEWLKDNGLIVESTWEQKGASEQPRKNGSWTTS